MHPVKHVAGTALDDERTRRWVGNLRRPERLDDPVMRHLLRVHGRGDGGSVLEVGRRAAALLREKIAELRPSDEATPAETLPHAVLTTCFVDGAKSYQAAARLGLSERQLTRERARAISLLTSALASAAPAAPVTLPRPGRLVPRPEQARRLAELSSRSPRVDVYGVAGAGKTCLVAAFAGAQPRPVCWFTAVPRVAADLRSILFDLGESLAAEDASLAAYVRDSLPSPDLGLATRIALSVLGREERLLVLDGFDALRRDPATAAFLGEAAARLPLLRVVTVARRRPSPATAPALLVPPLNEGEVRALLALRGVTGDPALAEHVGAWTRGNARLVDLAAGVLGAPAGSGAGAAAALSRTVSRADYLVSCARVMARPRHAA